MHPPKEITNAHQIAFIYLYFATETDKKLTTEEMMTISDKIENILIGNINKGSNLNAWDILSESLNWYTSLNLYQKEENYIKIMEIFRENLTKEQKACIILDLKEIAKSDGIVLEAEETLIKKSEKMLGN